MNEKDLIVMASPRDTDWASPRDTDWGVPPQGTFCVARISSVRAGLFMPWFNAKREAAMEDGFLLGFSEYRWWVGDDSLDTWVKTIYRELVLDYEVYRQLQDLSVVIDLAELVSDQVMP